MKKKQLRIILSFCFVLLFVNSYALEENKKPFVEININNNPSCNTSLENIAKAEIWNLENEPNILINGENFSDGFHIIQIIIDGKIIAEEKINPINNIFERKFNLEKPLKNLNPIIKIKIDDDFTQIFNVQLNKLYGNVKYFNGKPVSEPIIIADDILTIGDSLGYFEIYLSNKKKYTVSVFDKDYSKKTLECYLYDVNLSKDTNVNILIDKLEVYQLHCWQGFSSTYLHFIPMSVSRANRIDKEKFGNQKLIASQPDVWPEIKKDEIKVFVNESEVSVLTFCVSDDFLYDVDSKSITRPAYLISIPKVKNSGQIIKVQVQDSLLIDGKKIIEKGEGYYFGFY
jgi:hypothetical protein